MTLKKLIEVTGQLPNKAITEGGVNIESDVQPNGKLGFMATIWQTKGTGYREHLIEYATGNTAEIAKENLKAKILKTI